jgi:hypothetical protein
LLSADELLAGSTLTFDVEVPAGLIDPTRAGFAGKLRLRPLTVHDVQLISRAARDSDSLTGALMVHAALEEPKLSLLQVNALPIGLIEFLLGEVNRISAIAVTDAEVAAAAAAPLSRAAFVLAREYGWTPQQVSELTLGQVLLHLEMLTADQA